MTVTFTLPRIADQRVVVGAAATLEVFFYDQDGEPANPGGTVTVGITRGDGTLLVAPGTAATDDTSEHDGRYTYALAAGNNSKLDLLTVTWTNGTTTIVTLVEVVGAVYFTIAEARAAVASLTGDDYSDAQVLAGRRIVEYEFERICGVAFVPRYRRARIDVYSFNQLLLPDPLVRAVRSIISDLGVVSTPDQLAQIVGDLDGQALLLKQGTFPFSITRGTTIEYEHGMDRPPVDVKDVAFTRLREVLAQDSSGVPERTTSFSTSDGMQFRLDTADADGPANPDIAAVLKRPGVNFRLPGVG